MVTSGDTPDRSDLFNADGWYEVLRDEGGPAWDFDHLAAAEAVVARLQQAATRERGVTGRDGALVAATRLVLSFAGPWVEVPTEQPGATE